MSWKPDVAIASYRVCDVCGVRDRPVAKEGKEINPSEIGWIWLRETQHRLHVCGGCMCESDKRYQDIKSLPWRDE